MMKFMVVSKDQIIQRDTEYLMSNPPVKWDCFKNKSVLITGATGLLGSHLVRTFTLADKTYRLGMKIYAFVRDKKKATKMFSDIEDRSKIHLLEQDIIEKIKIPDKINYVFHCANITDSQSFVCNPVETIKTTVLGCMNVLEYAKERHIDSMVYLSSMEIYGEKNKKYIMESDYGHLNPMSVRSSYPEAKRICECMCAAYAKEYNVSVKVARLTQTFGPGVRWDDNRVFAQFARKIIEKENIVLHTEGKTVRNYCYTRDAIAALLIILLRGVKGEAYNVANEENEISILEMAQMLIRNYSDGNNTVIIENTGIEKYGYNAEGRTCICSDKLRNMGWVPEVGLEDMFNSLIPSMASGMPGCTKV